MSGCDGEAPAGDTGYSRRRGRGNEYQGDVLEPTLIGPTGYDVLE